MAESQMTPDERAALWKQYAQAHAKAQETFDGSVRTLAAAGVAVAVSLITALKETSWASTTAVVLLLLALGLNLVSYVTAQRDLNKRREAVLVGTWNGAIETPWTKVTYALNVLAGVALLSGGCFLAYFVALSA